MKVDFIYIFLKKPGVRRLEDVDVIALRSAPPAGQRQACLQHDFGLSWNRKPRHRGLQTRFSTIMCKIYSFSFFRYLLDNTSFSFFFHSGFLFFCFFFFNFMVHVNFRDSCEKAKVEEYARTVPFTTKTGSCYVYGATKIPQGLSLQKIGQLLYKLGMSTLFQI